MSLTEATVGTVTLPATSKEYLNIPVLAFEDNGISVGPITATPKIALVSHDGIPRSSEWRISSWLAGANPARARVLLGPTGVVLDIDTYAIWLMLTGTSESPIRRVGTLVIT